MSRPQIIPQSSQYATTLQMLEQQNRKNAATGKNIFTPNENNQTVSQGVLVTEAKLLDSTSAYQLNFNAAIANATNNGAITTNERRLPLQNLFVIYELGYYLRIQRTQGGVTTLQNQLFTHPPGQLFSGTNLQTLNALWNGLLQFNVNNQPITTGWDLWRHYETPQTQYPTFTTSVATDQYPVSDEIYGSTSGMYPVVPGWVLDGGFNNYLVINFNNSLANIGLPTDPAAEYRITVVARGMMCQNCAAIMTSGIASI